MKTKVVLALCLLAGAAGAAKTKSNDVFYVYQDKGAVVNHYIPSGWMGDYGDIKMNDGDTTHPVDGKTDIKVTYTAEGKQGAGWAGVYWQHSANNWGDKGTGQGFDLTGYKRLTFWARGESGKENIQEFKVGGITGENPDSDSASIGPVILTQDWKQYTIDLKGKDLHYIIGGFCWSTNRDVNPKGMTMYLDDIRYEK